MYVFSYLLTYILSTFTADFIDRQLISLIDNEINTSSRVFSHLTKQRRAALLYHPGNSQPLNDQSGVTIVMYRKIYLTKTNGFLDIFFFTELMISRFHLFLLIQKENISKHQYFQQTRSSGRV